MTRTATPHPLPVPPPAPRAYGLDDPVTTREALVLTCRGLTKQGYSVAVYPEAAIQWNIKAKEVVR